MQSKPSYETARANCERVLIKGDLYKADVFITRLDNVRYVVKDYSAKGFWERNLVGRTVIRREARAYRALREVPGIASKFIALSPFAFGVEYLEGQDFGAMPAEELGEGVIGQFERIISDLHNRGWVHLDLHRRSNILLVNNRVYVIDLASAMRPGRVPFLGGLLTSLIGIADRLSIIKLKVKAAPGLLTSREKRLLKIRNAVMPGKWQ